MPNKRQGFMTKSDYIRNRGRTGAQGPAVQGVQGVQGPQGPQGPMGPQGPTGPVSGTLIGTVTLTQTATLVAIAVGVRTLPNITLNGVVAGATYLIVPVAPMPTGYAIHNAVAPSNNTLSITLSAPVLAIGASYSINCKVIRITVD